MISWCSISKAEAREFKSDEFARQRQAIVDELQKQQQEMMESLEAEASKNDFTLRMTPNNSRYSDSSIGLLPCSAAAQCQMPTRKRFA